MAASKMSAQMPKGTGWGVTSAVDDAVARILKGEPSPMIPIIGMLDIKTIKIDPETGDAEAVVRIRRVEALTTADVIRRGARILMDAYEVRMGKDTMLPVDEAELMRNAFEGIDVDRITRDEQDEREAELDEKLTDPDRLRRHLAVVHSRPEHEVMDLADHDAITLHQSDHDRPAVDGMPEHVPDWWAWRRVDLEAAEAATDGEGPTDAVDVGHTEEGVTIVPGGTDPFTVDPAYVFQVAEEESDNPEGTARRG